jgi:hypothetical protein
MEKIMKPLLIISSSKEISNSLDEIFQEMLVKD